MALKDYVTPTISVPLGTREGGPEVTLRGLGLDDFSMILGEHMESASKIAVLYSEHKNSLFTARPFQAFLLTIAKDFPKLVMEVISIAADEPESKNVKIGIGTQLACLNAILTLTIEDAGGLGNLFARLRDLGANAKAEAEAGDPSNTAPSQNSTGPGERT